MQGRRSKSHSETEEDLWSEGVGGKIHKNFVDIVATSTKYIDMEFHVPNKKT